MRSRLARLARMLAPQMKEKASGIVQDTDAELSRDRKFSIPRRNTPSPSKTEREIPEGVETSDQDLHVRKSTRYLSRSEPVPAALIYYSSCIPDVHGIASDSGYILAAVSGPARSARDIAILCSYTWAFNAKQTSFGFLLANSATSEYTHGKQWHYRTKN